MGGEESSGTSFHFSSLMENRSILALFYAFLRKSPILIFKNLNLMLTPNQALFSEYLARLEIYLANPYGSTVLPNT